MSEDLTDFRPRTSLQQYTFVGLSLVMPRRFVCEASTWNQASAERRGSCTTSPAVAVTEDAEIVALGENSPAPETELPSSINICGAKWLPVGIDNVVPDFITSSASVFTRGHFHFTYKYLVIASRSDAVRILFVKATNSAIRCPPKMLLLSRANELTRATTPASLKYCSDGWMP